MKYIALFFFFLCLPTFGYAQLDVKNDSQILWGFIEFASRFMLYASGLTTFFSGLLYALYSPRPKFLRIRKKGRRHQNKPRTATIKKRVLFQNIFLASLGFSIFLAVLMYISAENMR